MTVANAFLTTLAWPDALLPITDFIEGMWAITIVVFISIPRLYRRSAWRGEKLLPLLPFKSRLEGFKWFLWTVSWLLFTLSLVSIYEELCAVYQTDLVSY
ncbi:hypothetical protein TSUD_224740 [Trifolium subterraneum]|uniref:Uncharacterized protein n=1 Tax=Trifolium subterraneum TaxID=3900 RepID=A0A2Z6MM17_TRISU|nr:hypothetical protein TSUD_224740 [Trifolium subterraneum]